MSAGKTAILCDFQGMLYDQSDPTLLSVVDYAHILTYPISNAQDSNTIAGYEGDKFIIQFPFRVRNDSVGGVTPSIISVGLHVLAKKSGKTDFPIETFDYNVAQACMLNGQQNPQFSTPRNYTSFPGDPFSAITLNPSKIYDLGTKKGYMFQYGLTLRYDYWNNIVTTNPGGINCGNDINNDIANVNNSWSNLIQNGWSLVARILISMQGFDGATTTFQYDIPITCQALGTAPLTGPSYISSTLFYDGDPNSPTYGNQVNGIISGGKTRVSITFTPDGSAIPAQYTDYSGTMFVDTLSGGVNSRRFASTEIPAENNSPWSPAPQNGTPDVYRSNGGVSINIFNTTGVVIIEGIYDDTITNWSQQTNNFIFAARLALKDNGVQMDSGIDVEMDSGSRVLMDS